MGKGADGNKIGSKCLFIHCTNIMSVLYKFIFPHGD